MDDLCFAVAQDPQTADLIRVLDTKKKTAVRGTTNYNAVHCV